MVLYIVAYSTRVCEQRTCADGSRLQSAIQTYWPSQQKINPFEAKSVFAFQTTQIGCSTCCSEPGASGDNEFQTAA